MKEPISRFAMAATAALALFAATAKAEFTVWVSDKAPNENPFAASLDALVDPNGSGTLYIYGDGEQLSGFAVDLALAGNAVKFAPPATVANPAGMRWNGTAPPIVTDSLASRFSAFSFGITGGPTGVGGPVSDEIPGIGNLLGQVGYQGLGVPNGQSQLTIRVHELLFANWATGGDVFVRLGGPDAPLVNGGDAGLAGPPGFITAVPEPTTLALCGLSVAGLVATVHRRHRRRA